VLLGAQGGGGKGGTSVGLGDGGRRDARVLDTKLFRFLSSSSKYMSVGLASRDHQQDADQRPQLAEQSQQYFIWRLWQLS